MVSLLERVPADIIQHIAYQGSPFHFEAAKNLRNLLLTCKHIHHALDRSTCPHLYADIYRSTFSVEAFSRRTGERIPDSGLAAELVQRHHVLRKIHQGRLVPAATTTQDLWTLLLMVLESDGLNDGHLKAANIYDCMLSFVRNASKITEEMTCLSIWLLYLTSTRRLINGQPELREAMMSVLRPLAYTKSPARTRNSRSSVWSYGRRQTFNCPTVTSPAIMLFFSWKEATSLSFPSHGIPLNRAVARATHYRGITVDDILRVQDIASRPLAGDASIQGGRLAKSIIHDQDYSSIVSAHLPPFAGNFTGIWEGTYLISAATCTAKPSSEWCEGTANSPMQCQLREDVVNHEKLPATSHGCEELTSTISNIHLTGKATPEHQEAWSGDIAYDFEGNVNLENGQVTLIRKNTEQPGDSWLFRGYVHTGTWLVGSVESSTDPETPSSMEGIFYMRKVSD